MASSRGLPGFLRRSLRRSFDSDEEDPFKLGLSSDDDDDYDLDDNTDSSSNNNKHNTDSQQQTKSQMATATDDPTDDNDASEDETSPNNEEGEGGEEEITMQQQQQQPLEEGSVSSFSESGFDNLVPVPVPPTLERRVSYRDSQFEKIVGTDVVKMSDLRKLGWNGIPVSEILVVVVVVVVFGGG